MCFVRLKTRHISWLSGYLPALSRVWQHVKSSDVSLGTRPRCSLVVNEEVKKPNQQQQSSPDIANLVLDLDLVLDSRFRSYLRIFSVSEMLAVQFSYCENLRISFDRKHNSELNGEKKTHALI